MRRAVFALALGMTWAALAARPALAGTDGNQLRKFAVPRS